MKYVNNLNKKYIEEMFEEIHNDYEQLKWKFNNYSLDFHKIKASPVLLGKEKFPFPIAPDLWRIYLWLIGEAKVPTEILEILQSICELVWYNPFLDSSDYHINWESWSSKKKLGYFIRCAFIALDLEEGRSINSKELALLSGLSNASISQKIKAGDIIATKNRNSIEISSEEAIKFIKSVKK